MTDRSVVIKVAFASVAIAALAGCGSSGAGDAISPPATATSTASPSSSATVTLRGTIIEGVAPNCHVIETTGAGRYALTGLGVNALRVGDVVEVVGHAEPTLTNPCGRTFVVTHLGPSPE